MNGWGIRTRKWAHELAARADGRDLMCAFAGKADISRLSGPRALESESDAGVARDQDVIEAELPLVHFGFAVEPTRLGLGAVRK